MQRILALRDSEPHCTHRIGTVRFIRERGTLAKRYDA